MLTVIDVQSQTSSLSPSLPFFVADANVGARSRRGGPPFLRRLRRGLLEDAPSRPGGEGLPPAGRHGDGGVVVVGTSVNHTMKEEETK